MGFLLSSIRSSALLMGLMPLVAGSEPPGWLHTRGLEIVDATDRPVLLRGVCLTNNSWGNYIWPQSEELQKRGANPLIHPQVLDDWVLEDHDIDRVAALGGNVVRYQFNWELFDADNPHRATNLTELRAKVTALNTHGIWVILCMSEAPDAGSVLPAGQEPPARPRTMFQDDAAWARFTAVWRWLAVQVADQSGIAGYEVCNEPIAPPTADGGDGKFAARLGEIARTLRDMDRRHLLFLPERHGRATDPGERYWSAATQGFVTDQVGGEGVQWEDRLLPAGDGVTGVVYVFHHYDPYDFTNGGAATFDEAAVTEPIAKRVRWANEVGKAPLIVTEYGVNRLQPPAQRARWMEICQREFQRHGLSSTFFEYKTRSNPDGSDGYGLFIDRHQPVPLEGPGHVPAASQGTVTRVSEAGGAPAITSLKDYLMRRLPSPAPDRAETAR